MMAGLWFEADTHVGDAVEVMVDADEGEEDGDLDFLAERVLAVVACIRAAPSKRRRSFFVTLCVLHGELEGLNFTRQMVVGEAFHLNSCSSDEAMRGELVSLGEAMYALRAGGAQAPLVRAGGAQALQARARGAEVPGGRAFGPRATMTLRPRRRSRPKVSADRLAKIESYSDPRVAEIAEMSSTGLKTRSRFYKRGAR